jgi:hypothetical protein
MCLTLLEVIFIGVYKLQGSKFVATLFESGNNLADEPTLDAVGLSGDRLN